MVCLLILFLQIYRIYPNICNVKKPPPPPVTLVGHYYPSTKKVTLDFSVNLTKENSKNYAVWFQIYRNGVMIKSPYYDYHYEEYLNVKGTEPGRYVYYVNCYYYSSNVFIGKSNTYTVTINSGGGSGCPYFYIKENDKYIAQNTIMYYGNSNMRDFFLFNYNNKNNKENMNKTDDIKGNNFIEAAISENEIETDYIDRIILKAIKYDSEYNLTINKDGQYLFWREREKIDSCINNEGDNIFSLLEYLDGNIYEAYPGDTIYIYRDTDNQQKATSSIISGIGVKPMFIGNQDDASLIIEYWTGKEWSDIVKIKPREYIYSVWNYIPQSTEKIRLIIKEQIDIDVITYPIGEPIKYNEFDLKLIDPTLHKINVMDKLLNEDNNTVKIENGDTLYFSFHSKSSNKKKKISYLLITDGYYRIEEQEDSNFIKTTLNNKTDIEYNGKVLKINNTGKIGKKYEIYNIIGRKIQSSILKTNTINTDNIPNGIYFLKLIGDKNDKMYKFEIIR